MDAETNYKLQTIENICAKYTTEVDRVLDITCAFNTSVEEAKTLLALREKALNEMKEARDETLKLYPYE